MTVLLAPERYDIDENFSSSSDEGPNYEWQDDDEAYIVNVMKQVPFIIPNDNAEDDRQTQEHYLLRYVFKGNYHAPIKSPKSILDIGCGNGLWLAEMAAEFPKAELRGIDILPTDFSEFPSNCKFDLGNVCDGLPYPDESFDFVHMRMLLWGFQAKMWPALLKEIIRVTRKGGWIQIVDLDITVKNLGPAGRRLTRWSYEGMIKRGINPTILRNLSRDLRESGLQNLTTNKISLPIGEWGGRIGVLWKSDVESTFQGSQHFITSTAGISAEEFQTHTQEALQEYEKNRSYNNLYISCAQRT